VEARPPAPGRAAETTAGTRTRTLAAERPRPILSEEPAGVKTGSNQEKDSHPQAAATPIIAEPPACKPRPRLFAAGAIKRLFSKIAKAVITELAPKPRRRKKRDEDTRGLFQKLALKIFGSVAPKTTEPDPWYMPPTELDETQRRRFREHLNQAAHSYSYQNQPFDYGHSTHLSPRL